MSFSDIIQIAAALIVSYFLGSLPTGYLMVKIASGKDIRNYGSGNIGATNTLRILGKKGGIIVLFCDLFKGVFAALIGSLIGGQYLAIVCGLFAVIGHTFPVWLNFKGGKGAATACGVMLIVSPLSAIITLLVWLAVIYFSRIVSLATIVAAIVLDIAVFALHYDVFYTVTVACVSLLVIIRHKDNIKRLLNGTEYKIGQKVK